MKTLRWMLLLMSCLSFAQVWAAEDDSAATAADTPVAAQAAAPAVTPVATPDSGAKWKRDLVANLNLNQAAFSNWAAGGSDLLSWQTGILAKLERDSAATNWLTTFKSAYGMTSVQGQGARKSNDELSLESVFAWKTWPKINPFISVSGLTQFDSGYDYTQNPAPMTSAFLDPGYFTESAGLKYIPDAVFDTRVGAALKQTVADRFAKKYTDDPSTPAVETSKNEFGVNWVSDLNLKFSKTSSFTSTLDIFYHGGGLDQSVLSWNNLLASEITKGISMNLEGDVRYDPVVSGSFQYKETFGLGFALSIL